MRAFGIVVLLVAAGVTGWVLGARPHSHTSAPGSPLPPSPGTTAPWEVLDSLAELLDREVEERLAMAEELSLLRSRIARLEADRGTQPAASSDLEPDPVESAGGTREAELPDERARQIAAFREAGFGEGEAAYYQQLQEDYAMARLYLRDQASREGWFREPRFREQLAELPGSPESLRASMDDATYSRYLYATGRPNHLRVTSVISGSPAETAGLGVGDVILRYDGERLFSARELRGASREGTAGETVSVDVIRNGDRMQVFLPRGPLGISITASSGLLDES